MSETLLFGVAGSPVLHSLSPHIFSYLFKKCGMNAVYLRLLESGGKRIVETAAEMGLRGYNVTAPAKTDILSHLAELSNEAELIQAVNTVTVDEKGRMTGHNTDWMGVVYSLQAAGADPVHKKALVLGAGGAGRAAVYGLRRSGAAQVILINRTESKGKKAAERLGVEFRPLRSLGRTVAESDILVSCVAGPNGLISEECLHGDLTILEADYRHSPLSKVALRRGCRMVGGREWLIRQALPAFKLMTGVKPPESVPLIARSLGRKAPQKKAISLIGFMGSGKTTVGRRLAELLARPFVDSDSVIEEEYQTGIKEIFNLQGEERFRKWEGRVLRMLLPPAGEYVFALGGGAVLDARNRDLIRRFTTAVWLWSSLKDFDKSDFQGRPLLDVSRPDKKARALLRARIPFYARSCDFVLRTDPFDAGEIAARIKDEVDQTL